MKTAIGGRKKGIDRYDWHSVENLFITTWNDKNAYTAYAILISNSIKMADTFGHSSWSITLYNKKIRLDVGQVEVLTLFKDGIKLLYKEPLSIHGIVLDSTNSPYYKAVPIPSNAYFLNNSEAQKVPEELIIAHNEYIKRAAELKKITPWKNAFSPAVVEYFEKLLDIPLPRPGYYNDEYNKIILPDEIRNGQDIIEGAKKQIIVNAYERNPIARKECIEAYGVTCCICGFNFKAFYGDIASDYIHIHHIKPLSTIQKEYKVDPINDLRPVCPNCHAVIHLHDPALSIDEMKGMLNKANFT